MPAPGPARRSFRRVDWLGRAVGTGRSVGCCRSWGRNRRRAIEVPYNADDRGCQIEEIQLSKNVTSCPF
ncbi:hypothetical protein IPC252_25635 [Pseudomonas aeruginosa]|nr:hypothetical protein IPC252_25635 [Pseudomonas aeruginosa]